MSDFQFEIEWQDAPGVRGPELRATWARLKLVASGRPITRVYDEAARTVRDAVYLPLYPLAEWLADQWWALWNESAASSSRQRSDYTEHHCLVEARDGYALPPLRIEPTGSLVRLAWDNERLECHRVEFVGHGKVWAKTAFVKDQFSSLVDSVVRRLEACDITGTLLQNDWEAIQSTSEEEQQFCEAAGALGLNPYTLDERERETLLTVNESLRPELAIEFFPAADLNHLQTLAGQIQQALSVVESNSQDLISLKKLRKDLQTEQSRSDENPWTQGYSFAQHLRARFNLNSKPLKSIDDIGRAVGTNSGEFSRLITEFPNGNIPFASLMGVNRKSSPGFVVRPGHPDSWRFRFCRALYEYLSSPSETSALVTDADTDRQKQNRAFAAEFLAPAAALRDHVGSDVVSSEQTSEIAEEFGVSTYVIEHQIKNHKIARVGRD